jgi:hypothetical protein
VSREKAKANSLAIAAANAPRVSRGAGCQALIETPVAKAAGVFPFGSPQRRFRFLDRSSGSSLFIRSPTLERALVVE